MPALFHRRWPKPLPPTLPNMLASPPVWLALMSTADGGRVLRSTTSVGQISDSGDEGESEMGSAALGICFAPETIAAERCAWARSFVKTTLVCKPFPFGSTCKFDATSADPPVFNRVCASTVGLPRSMAHST